MPTATTDRIPNVRDDAAYAQLADDLAALKAEHRTLRDQARDARAAVEKAERDPGMSYADVRKLTDEADELERRLDFLPDRIATLQDRCGAAKRRAREPVQAAINARYDAEVRDRIRRAVELVEEAKAASHALASEAQEVLGAARDEREVSIPRLSAVDPVLYRLRVLGGLE
jgi:chromosome segregation ATPase